MSKIHVNGIDLYYEQEGRGAPLVLISGYTTDLSAWTLIRQELAKHFQLFMFDNRGAGRSDSPDSPCTIDVMADDTRALIEALRLHRPYILGQSMGGAIAQTLAFKYPESTGKLILANTFIRLREASAFSLRYFFKLRSQGMPLAETLEGSLPWLFSSAFLKNKAQTREFIQLVEKYPYLQSLVGQKRQLEAILQFDSEPWFKKISVPTLIIEGGDDIICPADSQRLAEGILGARLVSFPNQAHMLPIEKPAEFVDAILSFLNS